MRNIGIFTHDLYPYKPWGQGRYVYDLTRAMRRLYGGRILVFSPSPGINDPDHIEIFSRSHESPGKNITFSLKLGCVLEKLAGAYNLGLVHYQGGAGGLFLVRKPSVPLVYTVHHTYYQQSAYIRSQKWKKILSSWERFSYRNSDSLICVSPSTERAVARQYGVSGKSRSIANGVDQSHFHPLDIPRIPNSLLFIGRLETRKGIDFLLKSMPLVRSAQEDIRLFIAGDGILKPDLEKTVKDHGMEENVRFLGVLGDDAVNEWYNKVSLVVVPSVFEGFGLNAAEAMACGTPVVATEVDGLRDVVEDGVTGRLVEYGNLRSLSDAVVSLLKNDPERDRLAENAKRKITAMHNWESIARQVLEVYESVLTRRDGVVPA